MPAGRPTDYSDDLADRICMALADGQSLVEICTPDDMPNRATVFRWLHKYPEFSDMYAKAREVQAECLADELLQISDNGKNDWMERNGEDSIGWQVNGEAIQRSRLRVDTRKWVAAKLLPRKYGDKQSVEMTGKDGGELNIKVTIGGND